MRVRLLAFLFFSLLFNVYGQNKDYTWWNNIHNWDGVRSWSQYIPVSPGKMGPNALPVPDMQNGAMDSNLTLLAAAETHYNTNDFTANLFTRINIPVRKAIELQIWWVPVAYFKTDTVVRDMRAARTREAEGFATGDIYIGTLIPLVQHKKGWPDLLLSINLKTASGNRLEDARFTDSPGYFFDLSGGKDFDLSSFEGWQIRPYALAGFYVYQTNRDDYYQNDAFLWGVGVDLKNEDWHFVLQASGYIGYLDDFDQPTVIRLELQRLFTQGDLVMRIQQGNASYPFLSARLGWRFKF
jgi:hypothetical protein